MVVLKLGRVSGAPPRPRLTIRRNHVTIDDLTERLRLVPGKANLFFYGSAPNIDIVAEWREGEQPMRRVVISLGGVFAVGGPVQ